MRISPAPLRSCITRSLWFAAQLTPLEEYEIEGARAFEAMVIKNRMQVGGKGEPWCD
jgi:hypothetical protein